MTDTAETWTQRIAWASLVSIVVGGISWAAWISNELNGKLSIHELDSVSPYTRDRLYIDSEIKSIRAKIDGEFTKIVQQNTEAIIRLQEQLAYNSIILKKIEDTIHSKK